MIPTIILLIAFTIIIYFLWKKTPVKRKKEPVITPPLWRNLLQQHVHFYRNLNTEQKLQFESDIQRFLTEIRISGVQTEVELLDRLLIASSAIIPLFGFPAWNYKNLDEVLLYPTAFDRNYNLVKDIQDEYITGMVGSGAMEGKMILSKPSLRQGFDIANDKKNVGIHEFVHLFDKETGAIDAIPPGYDDKSFSLPWLQLIREKTEEIYSGTSDINPYGGTNKVEFFAVASEYFFERPHLLKQKHPELYHTLSKIFRQDMTAVIEVTSFNKRKSIGRNDPCPCGSGKKYKKCCGN